MITTNILLGNIACVLLLGSLAIVPIAFGYYVYRMIKDLRNMKEENTEDTNKQ